MRPTSYSIITFLKFWETASSGLATSMEVQWGALSSAELKKNAIQVPNSVEVLKIKRMSGDKNKKGRATTQSNVELETHQDDNASRTHTGENDDWEEEGPSPAVLCSLQKVVSEVVAEGSWDVESEMTKRIDASLTEFPWGFENTAGQATKENHPASQHRHWPGKVDFQTPRRCWKVHGREGEVEHWSQRHSDLTAWPPKASLG